MSDIRSYLPLWGQWNTEDLIGEGSDSKVYRAVKLTAGGQEFAAIKQIFVAPTEDPEQSERRARALLALADRQISLRGKPHLIETYERQAFHRADGGYDIFVRMELSTSLRSVMGKTEFSEAMLSQLGQDISAALLILEEAGTCHGALHPANIFLSRDGTYKLGDYCRSRIRTSAGSAREYLAPEVLTGSSLPSVGADRYSLGMVLYRLSNTLRGPFLPPAPASVSREEITQADRRRIRGEKLPDPAQASQRLAAILQRACAFAPENRYPTTEALQHDFMILQDPEAEMEAAVRTVRPQTGAEQLKKEKNRKDRKKKSPAFLIGAILAAVILLAGAVTAAVIVKNHQDKKAVLAASPETTAQTEQTEQTEKTEHIATAPPGTTAPPTTEAPETTENATEPETAQLVSDPTKPPESEPAEPSGDTVKPQFSLNSTYNFVDFTIPASGYILADSATRYITYDDLAGMTKNQVRLACNEIFARKGRIFTSQTMKDYFGAMPWYNGTVDPGWFDTHPNDYLTAIEQANARTIVQYEHSRGWG